VDRGGHAIGIILSGSGTDGTSGLQAIQDAGGLTFAQAPETAAHDNMPRSAIDAGAVHDVLPVREMPARLLEHAKAIAKGQIAPPRLAAPPVRADSAAPPSDHELVPHLGAIYEIIQRATGHDFSHYKRGTVLRRFRRRLQQRRASSLEGYVELLSK